MRHMIEQWNIGMAISQNVLKITTSFWLQLFCHDLSLGMSRGTSLQWSSELLVLPLLLLPPHHYHPVCLVHTRVFDFGNFGLAKIHLNAFSTLKLIKQFFFNVLHIKWAFTRVGPITRV